MYYSITTMKNRFVHYEVRKFGIRSAMPSKRAIQLCPGLIFIPPRFEAYKAASAHIHEVFHRYADIIETVSLDEARSREARGGSRQYVHGWPKPNRHAPAWIELKK